MLGTLGRRAVAAGLAALITLASGAALALDKVRIGKAVPNSFAFSAAEIGIDAKIWQTEGIELAVSAFRGDAQMQQALKFLYQLREKTVPVYRNSYGGQSPDGKK